MKWSTYLRAGLQFAVAESGHGKPVVFQHGLCGDGNQPAEVFPGNAGFRCITLECRGHGQSDAGAPESFSIAAFADDVCSLIDNRGLAPVVLGGISMGAAIALRLAVLRPELVRGLILARPAWLDAAAPPNLRPNMEVGVLLRRHPPAEALARFEASETRRVLATEGPDNLASLLGFFKREPIATTAELLSRIASDGPGVTESQIAAICCPTLVIASGRDYIHPLDMARALTRLIPSARLVEITPKAESLDRYRSDFRDALATFLGEL